MGRRNWHRYNQDLVKRGSLTFFIDPKALLAEAEENKRGRPRLFSSALIHLLLILKIQYCLTYRALEGFARSILPSLQKAIRIPTYSLTCKRASSLEAILPKLSSKTPKVVLIDATGVKVYGEGEWKVKKHGASKRRRWIKLHIVVDQESQEIINLQSSDGYVADCIVAPQMIKQLPSSVETVIGDGGYDTRQCREAIDTIKAKELIPPRRNSQPSKDLKRRNKALREIVGLGKDELARQLWGKLTGYSRRALVETAFSRLKRVHSERFFSKKS